MDGARWPMIVGVVVLVVLVGAGSWALGRSGRSGGVVQAAGGSQGASVKDVKGISVGVLHSRAGALAAADNYVAESSQLIVKDPAAYNRLIRTVWVPAAQRKAIADGVRYRRAAPEAVQNYAAGGQAISVVGARKMQGYEGARATVVTWGGGFVWGPAKKPTQRWFLARVQVVWSGELWRVEALDELDKPAPTPYQVVVGQTGADRSPTFDRELAGMTAPIYGSVEATP